MENKKKLEKESLSLRIVLGRQREDIESMNAIFFADISVTRSAKFLEEILSYRSWARNNTMYLREKWHVMQLSNIF